MLKSAGVSFGGFWGQFAKAALECSRQDKDNKKMVIINCDMGEAFGLYKMGDDEGLMPQIEDRKSVV